MTNHKLTAQTRINSLETIPNNSSTLVFQHTSIHEIKHSPLQGPKMPTTPQPKRWWFLSSMYKLCNLRCKQANGLKKGNWASKRPAHNIIVDLMNPFLGHITFRHLFLCRTLPSSSALNPSSGMCLKSLQVNYCIVVCKKKYTCLYIFLITPSCYISSTHVEPPYACVRCFETCKKLLVASCS